MNILLISKSDDGGAGRAAYRLHQGLKKAGASSQMLVELKANKDRSVLEPESFLAKLSGKLKLTERLDALPLKLYNRHPVSDFSLQWLPHKMLSKAGNSNADVINLHWACHGYLSIEKLGKMKQPMVWTLHDMWAFTGGCHYNGECERYIYSCGSCPQIKSLKENDFSRWVWQRKQRAWKNLNLTVVTPSVWLAKCAASSSLFKDYRIEVIPNGLDLQKYKPLNRQFARECLNLPQDKKLILCGAMDTEDQRKGFYLLKPALVNLEKLGWDDKVDLVMFGASERDTAEKTLKTHYLGRLHDDTTLALAYAAADVFVAPSTQDNLPNTVMESLACGTPSVAFKIGGMPDLIEHQQNGYLAKPFEIDSLAEAIIWVLEDQERHKKLCYRAREKAEQEFSLELQAHRYLSLFEEV